MNYNKINDALLNIDKVIEYLEELRATIEVEMLKDDPEAEAFDDGFHTIAFVPHVELVGLCLAQLATYLNARRPIRLSHIKAT